MGTEVSRGTLQKVPALHLKAEKLGPRVLGVKEVVFEWFSFVELKPEHKIQALTGLEPMTSAIPVQCSTN